MPSRYLKHFKVLISLKIQLLAPYLTEPLIRSVHFGLFTEGHEVQFAVYYTLSSLSPCCKQVLHSPVGPTFGLCPTIILC